MGLITRAVDDDALAGEAEWRAIAAAGNGPQGREGVAAFPGKRKPNCQGG